MFPFIHPPAYEDLLEMATNAMARFKEDWPEEKQSVCLQSTLDECFLKLKNQPTSAACHRGHGKACIQPMPTPLTPPCITTLCEWMSTDIWQCLVWSRRSQAIPDRSIISKDTPMTASSLKTPRCRQGRPADVLGGCFKKIQGLLSRSSSPHHIEQRWLCADC